MGLPDPRGVVCHEFPDFGWVDLFPPTPGGVVPGWVSEKNGWLRETFSTIDSFSTHPRGVGEKGPLDRPAANVANDHTLHFMTTFCESFLVLHHVILMFL